jgi:hypothetical protein
MVNMLSIKGYDLAVYLLVVCKRLVVVVVAVTLSKCCTCGSVLEVNIFSIVTAIAGKF